MRQVLNTVVENWRILAKVLVAIALLLVIGPFVAHIHPGLIGADVSYVVQSGSMEPTIPTGSVIFVNTDVSAEQIEEGDIITFSKGRRTVPTTHRVYEKRTATVNNETSVSFVTKGDDNEDPDPEPVYRGDLVGTLMFSVPYVGYVVAFAGTRLGWLTLVVVPVFLLFLDGLWQIYSAIEFEETGE